jgi:hypothetical protein
MIGVLRSRPVKALLLLSVLAGCRSTYNVDRADSRELSGEGTVVFVRPTEYSLLGTKSLSDYVEVVYEQAKRNGADLLELRVGLRDKGGQHFWDVHGKDFSLSAKTAFYAAPIEGEGQRAPAVYETNWQRLTLLRGATTDYKVVCPVKAGKYYQVTLSELK